GFHDKNLPFEVSPVIDARRLPGVQLLFYTDAFAVLELSLMRRTALTDISRLREHVNRLGRGVFALIRFGNPARKLCAGIGDCGAESVLLGVRGRGPAIAPSLEDHADLAMHSLAAETRNHDVAQHQGHKEDAQPNGFLHTKKFPILRNFVYRWSTNWS